MQPMMFGVESVPCYATLGHRQPVPPGMMMDRRGFHAWTLQRPHASGGVANCGQQYFHLPPTVYEEPDDKVISSASSHGGASTSPLIMAVPRFQLQNAADPSMMPSRTASLATDRFRSLHRPPKLGVSAFQGTGAGMSPQRRFVRSDWDIRPVAAGAVDDHLSSHSQFIDAHSAHSNGIAYTASSADGTSEVDSGEPSPQLPLGLTIGDGFLRSQRHHGHYFSNADLFVQPIAPRYNYLKYAKASDFDGMGSVPHLRIIDFGFELDARSCFDKAMLRSNEATVILDGVTFELFGGDTCALMYTSETEVSTFLRIIANANPPRGQVSGSLELNGHNLRSRQLGDRIAFASADPPPPSLTAGEYLDYYSRLVGPATNAMSRRRLIDQLIHGLALGPLRNRLCRGLSSTEMARLKLAAKMCLDTDILVAENLLTDMDLYDAAFVIDYIRDWAQRFNRIVIMACVPPTTELLTMFRKCAVLSSGRLVYFGESDSMCEYFESIGFPSPPLKNPCDYYVDLVTHDYLTPESAMESSSRIRTLADLWAHKQPPLTVPQNAIISPRVHRPSIFSSFVTNYSRAWSLFLNRPWPRLAELSISVILSLLIGWVFYDLPRNRRSGIDDREGFLTTMLCLAPTLMAILGQERIFELRTMIEHDRRAGIHSPGAHLIATLLFDLPFAVFASLALGAPAYFLVKLNPLLIESLAALIAFLAPFTVNFLLYRYTGWLFALLADSKLVAGTGVGITAIINLLLSGFPIHETDQWHALGGINLQFWSPTRWIGRDLMDLVWQSGGNSHVFQFVREFTNETIAGVKLGFPVPNLVVDCERKPIVATKLRVPVLTVKKCLKTTGTQVMAFFDFDNDSFIDLGWIVVASWIATLLIVLWGVAACCRPKTRVGKSVDSLRLRREG